MSVPLGVLCSRMRRPGQLVLGVASVIQTVPSLALLAFLVPCLSLLGLHSIGVLPALIGLFVYTVYVAQVKHFSGWAGSFALSLIVIPVVVRSVLDSSDVADAIDMRSFGAVPRRTWLRELHFAPKDFVLIAFSILFLAACVALTLWMK